LLLCWCVVLGVGGRLDVGVRCDAGGVGRGGGWGGKRLVRTSGRRELTQS